ncbi:MAG: hypothetical protein M0Z29_03695 [Actinomycetota bacterium]|nr:hypothetical protein [Actinomycetota bacterium]MDA8399200.1 hypothetical protein [Actinomycetota bacterium]
MSVVAVLDSGDVSVDPGKNAETSLTVYNTGDIVEQFNFSPVGDAAPWMTFEPQSVSLFPNTSQKVKITFAPPRNPDVKPGDTRFGAMVVPMNSPDSSVVEEGNLKVGTYNDIKVDLAPQSVSGRVRARMSLAVDSRGNTPANVSVVTRDPSDSLAFMVRPRTMQLIPGKSHFVKIRIRPRKKIFRGQQRQHRFKVQVLQDGADPVSVDGQMSQRPVLSRLGLALLAVAAALAIWFALVKPAVKNVAVSALAPSIAAQNQASSALSQKVSNVNSALSQAASQVSTVSSQVKALSSTTTSSTTSSTTTTAPPPPKFVNVNFNDTLETIAQPGSSNSTSYVIPAGSTLSLTDLVVENLAGGVGYVRIEQYVASSSTTRPLFIFDLLSLTSQSFSFKTPAVLNAGDKFILQVQCGPDQTACDVATYFAGGMNQPA